MALLSEEKVSPDSEEQRPQSLDEKLSTESIVVDLSQADEALQLVGAERTTQFSEEYNLKLRRKLVRIIFFRIVLKMNVVWFTGLDDTTAMCGCVFHAIFVSLPRNDLFDATLMTFCAGIKPLSIMRGKLRY